MQSFARKVLFLFSLLFCLWSKPVRGHAGHEHPVHPDDPHKAEEHLAALDLVKLSNVTNKAVRSGDFRDPRTWEGMRVPNAGARVWIPEGIRVTVSDVNQPALDTVRVSGEIIFHPDYSTRLIVHTMVIDTQGKFTMGTAARPIQRGRTAVLFFRPDGPLNRQQDPLALGLGLISHGETEINGSPVIPYMSLYTQPRKGVRTLQLAKPVDWSVGDTVVIMGTKYCGAPCKPQDESRTIKSISPNRLEITLSKPLEFDHTLVTSAELASQYGRNPPLPEALKVFVANMSRNAKLFSMESAPDRRGHFMQMHKTGATIRYAEFFRMGRTQKAIPLNDSKRDERGALVPGTGTNPRGRYPLHFHQTGIDAEAKPNEVVGVSINTSPGWGIVNHESYVNVKNSVSYDVVGAHYVAESGVEIGSFVGNLALKAVGLGRPEPYVMRREILDFGVVGHGFWLHSAGLDVRNNLVTGTNSMAYVYYPWSVLKDQNGNAFKFPAKNLRDPLWAGNKEWVSISEVPLHTFKDNVAIGVYDGLRLYGSTPIAEHLIERLTVVNSHTTAFGVDYSHNYRLKDCQFIGYTVLSGGAMYIDSASSTVYENNYIVGFGGGVVMGYKKNNILRGGYLNNRINVVIQKSGNVDHHFWGPREITIENVQMGRLRSNQLHNRPSYDIDLQFKLFRDDALYLTSGFFHPEKIIYNGRQLYYSAQLPDFKVTGTRSTDLEGLTNRQLMQKYELAIAGTMTPTDARKDARISGGFIGSLAKMDLAPPLSVILAKPVPGKSTIPLVAYDPERPNKLFRAEVPVSSFKSYWNIFMAKDDLGRIRPLIYR